MPRFTILGEQEDIARVFREFAEEIEQGVEPTMAFPGGPGNTLTITVECDIDDGRGIVYVED